MEKKTDNLNELKEKYGALIAGAREQATEKGPLRFEELADMLETQNLSADENSIITDYLKNTIVLTRSNMIANFNYCAIFEHICCE
ncbi:MAG: hypothetical protein IKD81_08260 [Eubacteriaceae bacterium]|nr:hypothetical protein [Eubacteriaceae bacterium]